MNEYESRIVKSNPNGFVERRHRKKDWVIYAASVMSAIGWLFAIFAFTFLDQAKPMQEDFFTRLLNVKVCSFWNSSLLYLSLFLMVLAFLTCIIGFIFNMRRHRRKTDRYHRTIIILCILSSIFLALFLWKFWYLIF